MTGYDKVRKGYKWEVLALLWVAYLLNQADRQVFNVVLPLIREDLGLSDVAVGTIPRFSTCSMPCWSRSEDLSATVSAASGS